MDSFLRNLKRINSLEGTFFLLEVFVMTPQIKTYNKFKIILYTILFMKFMVTVKFIRQIMQNCKLYVIIPILSVKLMGTVIL